MADTSHFGRLAGTAIVVLGVAGAFLVFKAGRVPTIGRFSFAGGNPYVAAGPESVRGFGLLFKLPDGEEWRTAMINTAVFGVHTPQAFYDRLFASQPDPKKASPIRRKWRDFVAPGISSKETHY